MPELIPVLDKNSIAEKVAEISRRISRDYQEADLVLIGVLKGAFIFMADLIRQINVPQISVDFIQTASYGNGAETSGCVQILKDIQADIRGKDVLIVEDILDTGITLACLLNHLKKFEPRSLKICTLIDKPERRQNDLRSDYTCFTIEKGFLVGYGLDYAEAYRNLPGVYHLKL
jgi:hypoxanthine phosphoribosyltransferase